MRGWKKSRAPTRFVWDWGLWCDKVTEQVRFRPDRETIRPLSYTQQTQPTKSTEYNTGVAG